MQYRVYFNTIYYTNLQNCSNFNIKLNKTIMKNYRQNKLFSRRYGWKLKEKSSILYQEEQLYFLSIIFQQDSIFNRNSSIYVQIQFYIFILKFFRQNEMGGAFLSQPISTKNTNIYQHSKIRVVTSQMQGWRKNMQDAMVFHRISKQVFLFAVFDGHGGVQVSRFCAKHIVEQLSENQNFQKENYEQALEETFRKLDQLLDSQQGQAQLKQITIQSGLQPFANDSKVVDSVGCTGNVVLMVQNTIYVANAGDSRAALSRGGKIIQLSKDHKPEQPEQERRINAAGAKVQKGRINGHLNLSRCLGDYHYKRNQALSWDKQVLTAKPQVKKIKLCKQDDFIIIGCDGIWERYQTNGQGLIDLIRQQRLKGKQPQVVLQQFLDKNLGGNPSQQLGCDNMSVILVEFNKKMLE